MGYDLHVVRTKEWVDADTRPILQSDVEGLMKSDKELAWSTRSAIYTKNTKVIDWRGDPCFYWYRCEIIAKNPNQKQIIKLAQIAAKLNAYCVGDEDEQYVYQRGWLGGESVKIIPAT